MLLSRFGDKILDSYLSSDQNRGYLLYLGDHNTQLIVGNYVWLFQKTL